MCKPGRGQWQLNRLKFLPPRAFDMQSISLEIKDHNQDVEETGLEARRGEAARVRDEARKDLPTLNMPCAWASRC